MAGGDRIRLFCALRLPREVVDGLVAWQRRLPLSEGTRLVPAGNLHVTLAFLGSRPAGELPAVAGALDEAAARAEPVRLRAGRYREGRMVGMIVLDDLTGAGAALAADLGARLERLGGFRPEARAWLPHVTVSRFRARPRLRPAEPDLGEFTPSDAAVYSSLLRPTGAQYEVRHIAALSQHEPGGL